jgi:DNA polymerase-3 subunit alpha
LREEQEIEESLIDLAYKYNVPLVATNDVYFDHPEMFEAHDVLLCIAEGSYVNQPDRRRVSPESYFKSAKEMRELFRDLPEAIDNTLVIAKRCGFVLESSKPMLPAFPTEKGEECELKDQALEGLEMRLQNQVFQKEHSDEEKEKIRKDYLARLDFELETIIRMGYAGYYLIVADFIKWAKTNGIPVGPGRGSGAGSLVAWSLTITDIDPIRFGLIFERFLNPERVSMPDFDIDFCQERRDEVITYVAGRYGMDKVAQIITFGKLQARAVLRDVQIGAQQSSQPCNT